MLLLLRYFKIQKRDFFGLVAYVFSNTAAKHKARVAEVVRTTDDTGISGELTLDSHRPDKQVPGRPGWLPTLKSTCHRTGSQCHWQWGCRSVGVMCSRRRAYGTPFYYLILNSWYVKIEFMIWYVHIRKSNFWYVHIMNWIHDIIYSNSWYVHIRNSISWYVHYQEFEFLICTYQEFEFMISWIQFLISRIGFMISWNEFMICTYHEFNFDISRIQD